MKVFDIVSFLGECEYDGDWNRDIEGICTLMNPKENHLLFCKEGYGHLLIEVKNCCIVLDEKDVPITYNSNAFIITRDPRLIFMRIVRRFFMRKYKTSDVSIHITASIGEYVSLEGKIQIGENVNIQSHVSIGTVGFGYERNEEGVWEPFPQIGGVVIEKDVAIASGVNIHRGTIDDTIIHQGSKISINCNIGHNSVVGRHTFIGGKTNLGGKTKIGDYCFIGMGVITRPSIKIGNNVTVGMGALVTKDVPDDCITYGFPAKVTGNNPQRYGE